MGYGVSPKESVRQLTMADIKAPYTSGPFATAIVSAHNAPFEYAIYNLILARRYGWPARWNPSLWRCTMARAAMVGLPQGLDELTRVLRCKTPKDLEGRSLMLKMCRPLLTGGFDNDPEKLKRLYQYNGNDVISEMEVDALLPELPPEEQKIWELDLIMNRRGIAIDTDMAYKAANLSKKLIIPISQRVHEITRGEIDKATQNTAMIGYLERRGIPVPEKYVDGEKKKTLDKVGVTELLARTNLPPLIRELVELKRQASKTTSTAKYQKALEMICSDGRVRGTLQYHGAHTGRWAGRLLQTHNFPQGHDEAGQLTAVDLILNGDEEMFNLVYGTRGLEALSDTLRGMIVAGPGKTLVSGDSNAIEARTVFWLAGEEGALATYRQGGSPYLDMGEYIFKKPITKKNVLEYKVAKATVLGAGFGMGWETWRDNIYAETAKKGEPLKLPDELAKRSVNGYREKYAGVPRLWKEMEAAAVAAVLNPGQRYTAAGGKVLWSMSADRRFLVCRLPSGRFLWYWNPTVKMAKTPWGEEKPTLFYWGSYQGKWLQLKTYGGALTENVVQAIARDLLAYWMLLAEAAGFEMILTVHDELVAEVIAALGELRLKEFLKIMSTPPDWCPDFPVLAEGWTAPRYRK